MGRQYIYITFSCNNERCDVGSFTVSDVTVTSQECRVERVTGAGISGSQRESAGGCPSASLLPHSFSAF